MRLPYAVAVRWNVRTDSLGKEYPMPATNTVLVPHLWQAEFYDARFPYVAEVLKGWGK